MIFELKGIEFYRCRDLINECGQLEAKAVIEGVNPGRVFVDDIENPTSGLIWLGNNDGFIFIGNEQNETFNKNLNYFIENRIVPEATNVGLNWFEAIGNHSKWNSTIKEVFKNRNLGSWNQRVYLLYKEDNQNHDELSIEQGYKLMKIDKNIFENKDRSIENIVFLHSKILGFWDSPERFFSDGIGYCMVYKNEIVSVCFSGFVVGNVHCIHIETLEGHRGKKIAQTIARSFVKDCLDNKNVPYWDCMESNKPSVAVAEKIGFKKVFQYIGYEFPFK
ncbi:GNAT family N-acetyltransferase [Chryseomicrobium palamuruense]|uniref:GNAT family N-acetyltransferase n=1 Tax=Chryseomicrobium palamuruense TaxID=682973 RepID=A0ABV8V0Y4_9BACL